MNYYMYRFVHQLVVYCMYGTVYNTSWVDNGSGEAVLADSKDASRTSSVSERQQHATCVECMISPVIMCHDNG